MSDASSPLAWGILGTGGIAKVFADALGRTGRAHLSAVATRGIPDAGLAGRFPGARLHAGYEALLADPAVEAVYVATPHPSHARWAILAAEAGKAVLVEKPFTVNAAEAEAVVAAADAAGTFAAEAFMFRFHPQLGVLLDLLRDGAIGEVKLVEATFGFATKAGPDHRLLADAHAGGGVLDVGCYAMSMARLLAGAVAGRRFEDPARVAGTGLRGETGADLVAVASLAFPGGLLAQLSTSVALAQENTVRILGTGGRIELPDPWMAGLKSEAPAVLLVTPAGGETRRVEVAHGEDLYVREIEAVGEAVRAGRRELAAPGPSWDDTLGNMRALDAWRGAIGLTYGFETPEAAAPPVAGRPVSFARTRTMATRAMPGLDRPVSALALGTAGFQTMPQAATMLDAFFEAGGTLVDSAFWYGANGLADRLLGHWMASRGVRDAVTVIAKGAHTPLCYPDVIPRQLAQSLDRLRTGHADIYMMHRDNENVPVGEFVDAIDREVRAGRILSYGFSNWSLARVDEAIAYAEAKGLARASAISSNFSLAEMLQPVWAGCVAVSDAASRTRLAKGDLGVYAWSSQARGFFTQRSGEHLRDDAELVASWYGPRNFARKAAAEALGARLGRSATQVALAYCLAQGFPLVPLIGPLTPRELADSLGALDIALSPEDLRVLEA